MTDRCSIVKSTQAAFWNGWPFCLRVCLDFSVRPAHLPWYVCLYPQQSPTRPEAPRAVPEKELLTGEIQTHVTFLVLKNFGYPGSVHTQVCSSRVLLRAPSFPLVLKRLRIAVVVVFSSLVTCISVHRRYCHCIPIIEALRAPDRGIELRCD